MNFLNFEKKNEIYSRTTLSASYKLIVIDTCGTEGNLVPFSPNPSSTMINIFLKQEYNSEIMTVYSVSGQKLLERTIYSAKEIIDVSSFSKGIYFIEIGNSREKFVVE